MNAHWYFGGLSLSHENKSASPLLAHLSDSEAAILCSELRQELIENVAKTGGHLASNLGTVELTVAIHRVFDTGCDRLVFDVGHQSYTHKMLTGRRDEMATLRQLGGISGFPKPAESIHDAFVAGHASNSVAVAMGMAEARSLSGGDYHVLALIGDGALTGGLAYEGLSNAGQCGKQLLIILNDNGMSIAQNVGGVAEHLAHQRMRPQYLTIKKYYRKMMQATWLGRKIYQVTHNLKRAIKQSILPCSMFENMGFNYLGPINGHDIGRLTRTLQYAKGFKEPVLLHVRTVKGKNYTPAEQNPDAYHGVEPFNPENGQPNKAPGQTFASVFGKTLEDLALKDQTVCAITAAMPGGTGLDHFSKLFPDRFFDVGIAEGAAASMAAGMAKQGLKPVFAVYSTFLQRSYDMLLHDIALEGLHVVFGVDRAGFVGDDGETHHGVFDVAYLDSVPNMTVLAPSNFAELKDMVTWAVTECSGPVAVRYPRGREGAYREISGQRESVCLREGWDLTLVGYGMEINDLLEAAESLAQYHVEAEVIKLNRLTPLLSEQVMQSVEKTGVLIVAEDCVRAGSVGIRIAAELEQRNINARVRLLNSGDHFVTHGTVAQLKQRLGLDRDGIVQTAMEVLRHAQSTAGCSNGGKRPG